MAVTSITDMVVVPEKFAAYVEDRTVEKSLMVNSGIATPDPVVAALINGTPRGGRFIEIPAWKELEGDAEVFDEETMDPGGIKTESWSATLQIWKRAWGSTDLARVLGGADPMAAIANMIADWRNIQEQKVYLAILKALFTDSTGALKDHVNDISKGEGEAACISDGATLDTKQALGDRYDSLGMVFMHSAVYTYLQKNGMITRNPIFDPSQSSVEMERYLGYAIKVDDGMPQVEGVYDTYFLGTGAFIRETGVPDGLITAETARDPLASEEYLINRWAQVIHPRGLSWNTQASLDSDKKYPGLKDLEKAENWTLATNAKKVAIACLRHKIDPAGE